VVAFGWRATTTRAVARLAELTPLDGRVPLSASVETLPPIVHRYFQRSLPQGAAIPPFVRMTQHGQFRMNEKPTSWRPFTAVETFAIGQPAFVWDASIRMFPGLPVYVRDSYFDGVGGMSASAVGLVPLMNAVPSPELAEGALQRYLGEAVWFPAALLPSHGVTWTKLEGNAARAELTHARHVVSLNFEFSDDADVVRVWAAARPREVHGHFEPTPWEITCTNHQARPGGRVPLLCEVAWRLPGGLFPYWRGEVATYELCERP